VKFLIDECLAIELEQMAIEAGHVHSAHVNHRGMSGFKDHELMDRVLNEDWTLVTRNSNDFRPAPGSNSAAPFIYGLKSTPDLSA
jgi:predicted nuclease of predicted toxin-antitoxin system